MDFTEYARTKNQTLVAKVLKDHPTRYNRELAAMIEMSEKAFSKHVVALRRRAAEGKKNTMGHHGTGNVGVIGDTHLPYEHRHYLQFCKETFEANKVDVVVHIGDLIDNHSLSFHDSEPGLRGSRGEYEDARERLEPWYKAFPDVRLIYGNHDAIPGRQMKKIGLDPSQYMRPMEAVYDMPRGWSIHEEIEIDDVLYHHGHTACGVNGFRNDSKARFQSTVTGHAHGNSGVSYTATSRELVYGCAVGCGIDNSSMAFAYGKHFKLKPIVSCAVIKDRGRLPQVFPMPLGDV